MKEDELEEMSATEAFRVMIDQKDLTRIEGERSIEDLNGIAMILGYREDGFRYGSAFERFLQDNPGCVEAIHDWISENAEAWKDYIKLEVEIE